MARSTHNIVLAWAVALGTTFLPAAASAAPVETILHHFTNAHDGSIPFAGVVADSAGNLYGTAAFAGAVPGCSCGVVFRLSPPAAGHTVWTYSVLYAFTGGNDGAYPNSVIPNGTNGLIGSTNQGGAHGAGVVFTLKPPASGKTPWTETVIHTFSGGSLGGYPNVSPTLDSAGNLYGTTEFSGNTAACANTTQPVGCGIVYRLAPPTSGSAWTETVLYTFKGGADGAYPQADAVLDKAGAVYSTARGGGNATACPSGPFQGDGVPGCGLVFRLTAPVSGKGAWTESVLYTFTLGTDGGRPQAGLAIDTANKNTLYGLASRGGSASYCTGRAVPGCGVLYRLTSTASGAPPWHESVLHSFTDGGDGAIPLSDVTLGAGGVLYGGTSQGGKIADCGGSGCGNAFKLTPPAAGHTVWTLAVLHDFTGGSDGSDPASYGALWVDASGHVYGLATGEQTSPDWGTVFKITP